MNHRFVSLDAAALDLVTGGAPVSGSAAHQQNGGSYSPTYPSHPSGADNYDQAWGQYDYDGQCHDVPRDDRQYASAAPPGGYGGYGEGGEFGEPDHAPEREAEYDPAMEIIEAF